MGHKVSASPNLAYDYRVLWLECVSYFRGEKPVLDSVTMGVAEGDLVTVFGPHASGKSTLVEIAATVREPSVGNIWFAKKNLSTLQRASLPYVRRNIGYHGDRSLLVESQTVLDNILLALAVRGTPPDDAKNAALQTLTLLEATDIQDLRLNTLSRGQRHMASLARAVAGPPKLVVVDEPGVGVGGDVRRAVVRALAFARQQGAAVLCATADEQLAAELSRQGGKRVNLDHGRLVGASPIGLVPASAPVPPRQLVVMEIEDEEAPVALPREGDPR